MRPAAASFGDLGARLEALRRTLVDGATALAAEAEADHRPHVVQSIETLSGLACRIAVIGQVKAGKSSFISALVGRPDLLPSDVNPWTTVVTSLHFRDRTPPAESAHFQFFSHDEWRRIAEGGGPLRELTERLVPGFDPALLAAQLEAMRRRAEQRLGASFASLLGQSHAFPAIDRQTIARYVSAGPDGMDISAGWLSDITKSADLHFGAPRQGLPLTVVDTPGTNDPLLVRDEITRLNVASGDVFVVMLTAQQPLSSADIALLRLLRGLNKDRIVVFLNRIDGLEDVTGHTGRVLAHVREKLLEELPAGLPPMVAGSARWATIALAGADADVEKALDHRVRAYAARLGVPVAPGAAGPGGRGALLAVSGIPAVTAAIGSVMERGSVTHALRQSGQLLFQIAQSEEGSHREHVRALRRALGEAAARSEARTSQLRAWQAELDQIEAAGRQLQENLAFYEQSLGAIVSRCGADLRHLLHASLERFVAAECDDLARHFHARRAQVWRCDAAPLRKELQQEFLRIYGYWDGMLVEIDRQIMGHLERIMPRLTPRDDGSLPEMPAAQPSQPPGMTPLGRTLAFDLTVPWWRSWWSGQPTVQGLSERLVGLLRGEFEPLIEDLAQSAVSTLERRSRDSARQARLSTLEIVESIQRRSRELIGGLRQAEGRELAEMITRMEREVRTVEAQAARITELRRRFATVLAQCNTLLEAKAAG